MAWRDGILQGSYRGIPFYFDEVGMEGGRRTVNHEFPLRDNNYVEDMGRKARSFSIECYVVGEDWAARRDALIAALEAAGNGALVHPTLGTKQCKVSAFTVRERRDEGRVARFSVTFEESDEAQLFPNAGLDKLGMVTSAANSALLSLATSFLGSYNVALQPQFAIDSLVSIIRDGSTLLEGLFGNRGSTAQVQAEVRNALSNTYEQAPTIVRTPADIVTNVQGNITDTAAVLEANDAVSIMQQAYGLTSGANPPVATATRNLEVKNRNALFMLYRGTAAVEAARAAVSATFTSYNDALVARDSITGMLDEVAATAPDETYMALDSLRKEVVRAVPGADNDLPRLAEFTPVETMPSLVLAHYIYGNTDNEADIVARNRVRHPGFVVGNQSLEVLTQ